MNHIYCTECLDRIPFEYFREGKAVFSGGRPYLLIHAKRLGLKLDIKPPLTYAAAVGFAHPAETAVALQKISTTPLPTAKFDERAAESPKKFDNPLLRCELEVARNGGHAAVRINLVCHQSKANAVVIGRETPTIVLFKTNTRISRRHCRVWMADGEVFVEDLGSVNKTFIDGVELIPEKEYPLFNNQLLTLGAKNSEMRINLRSTGFPLLEKDPPTVDKEACTEVGADSSHS